MSQSYRCIVRGTVTNRRTGVGPALQWLFSGSRVSATVRSAAYAALVAHGRADYNERSVRV